MSNEWLSLFSESVNKELKNEQEVKYIPLTDYLTGEYLDNSRIFIRKHLIPLINLVKENHDFILPASIRKYSKIFLNKELNPEKIVFIDTETTGLNRSQGTFVFMLGIGQIKNEHFEITQYFVEEMSQEIILYNHLYDLFNQAELFVSYNGKSFDIPLLQSRLVLQRINLNIKTIPHLDLLPLARRLWKSKVEGFSLARMEYHLFEKIRDEEFDIPGYMIPGLYAEYQQTGNPEKLIAVFYHNDDDISSLMSLYSIITNAFIDKIYALQSDFFNILELGRLHEQILEFDKALMFYEHTCNQEDLKAELHLARLYKRMKKYDEAEVLWERIGDVESLIEIAIHNERIKNYPKALDYTKKAFEKINKAEYIDYKLETQIVKRIKRLENKN